MGENIGRLPRTAEVVIIGGGVIGLSIAYELAAAGVTDVLLIERGSLGSGSTCKAAGGVRAQFSDAVNIALGARSLETFREFGRKFDQEIDLREVGYLFLLDNAADVATFTRGVALQNEMGVPSRMIEAAEARRLSPLISTDDIVAAAFSATDGHCTPEAVVAGYARASRGHGAQVVTHCEVLDIEVADGSVVAVRTAEGRVQTGVVICAAGAWSRSVGRWAGVDLPVEPLRRQILVTEPIPDLDPSTPMTIDYSTSFYFHPEGRGMLVGMSDPNEPFGFDTSRSADWLPGLAAAVQRRAPALADIGVATGWAGLYEMTPDHNGLIGEAQSVSRFLYATGFSGHGFLMGPAVGEVVRDLYLGREPFVDVAGMSADRFGQKRSRPELNIV